MIILFLVFIVAGILDMFSIKIIGILLIIAETGGFIYFIVRYLKWKKRNLVRFKEFFKNTGIFLPEETIKKYEAAKQGKLPEKVEAKEEENMAKKYLK